MLCFKFLKSSGFTEKLKSLGILVPIRKPERGKTSHKHYILGLKFKKLDALTSKKTVFFVNRSLSFKLQTGSLYSSVLLSTFSTLNWNFNTFFESQNALTFKIFVSCNVCCKRCVNLLTKAFSDLGGLVNCLTEHRRDEKVFLAMGNARHHLLVDEFRPISLLNTDLKILSHVLASRLRDPLNNLIRKHQLAYLPKRSIHTAIIRARLAQEKLGKSNCVVAIDFSKAFDRMDRDYILNVLTAIGCPEIITSLISIIYTDTKAMIEIGGYLSRSIRVDNGIKQGCPLLPLIGILTHFLKVKMF